MYTETLFIMKASQREERSNNNDSGRYSPLSFRSHTEDSESNEVSKGKLFFDENSSNFSQHINGLIQKQNYPEPETSFKLVLKPVHDCWSNPDDRPGVSGLPPLDLKREKSTPLALKIKNKNDIFEEVLKTPQKDTKPFVNLILKKYHSGSQVNRLNLTSTALKCRRRDSEPEKPELVPDACNDNCANEKNHASLRLHFSSMKECCDEFSFEPEDGESDLLYEAKLKQNTIMQREFSAFTIKLSKPANQSFVQPVGREDAAFARETRCPENKLRRYFSLVDRKASPSFKIQQITQGYIPVKQGLKEFYLREYKKEKKHCGLAFFKTLFSSQSRRFKKSELAYLSFLRKLTLKDKDLKVRNAAGLVNSLSQLFEEVAVNVAFMDRESFPLSESDQPIFSFAPPPQTDPASAHGKFFSDLRLLGLETQELSGGPNVLGVMVFMEFIVDHFCIFGEVRDFFVKSQASFAGLFLDTFNWIFMHFSKMFRDATGQRSALTELCLFFKICFFVRLRYLSTLDGRVEDPQKLFAPSREFFLSNLAQLSGNYEKADKTTLKTLLNEILKF